MPLLLRQHGTTVAAGEINHKTERIIGVFVLLAEIDMTGSISKAEFPPALQRGGRTMQIDRPAIKEPGKP
jgi:hypothetical protein